MNKEFSQMYSNEVLLMMSKFNSEVKELLTIAAQLAKTDKYKEVKPSHILCALTYMESDVKILLNNYHIYAHNFKWISKEKGISNKFEIHIKSNINDEVEVITFKDYHDVQNILTIADSRKIGELVTPFDVLISLSNYCYLPPNLTKEVERLYQEKKVSYLNKLEKRLHLSNDIETNVSDILATNESKAIFEMHVRDIVTQLSTKYTLPYTVETVDKIVNSAIFLAQHTSQLLSNL